MPSRDELIAARARLSRQFGQGDFRDKLIRDRIAQIDRDLEQEYRTKQVISTNFRYVHGPSVASLAYVISQIRKPE